MAMSINIVRSEQAEYMSKDEEDRHEWYLPKIRDGQTEGYQLLCANCNWIKRVCRGEF